MMKPNLFTTVSRLLVAAACVLSSSACGSELLRTGRAPVFLQLNSLGGAPFGETSATNPYRSDVQRLVEETISGVTVKVPTVVNDIGIATIAVVSKDQTTLATTSPLNNVTITRYRVSYRRSDGRNTPGVDVPFGFDGAMAQTISVGGQSTVSFDLVRHSSKSEPPLSNLVGRGGLGVISTVAEVTFFGRDQNGNEVMVTGAMDVTFGDFADEA